MILLLLKLENLRELFTLEENKIFVNSQTNRVKFSHSYET